MKTPPEMPATLLGMPVVLCETMPEDCQGDIVIGSYVETYPLKMEARGGKIIGTIAPHAEPSEGVLVGCQDMERTFLAVPTARRRCSCGCGTRASHIGLGGGVALVSGCEWYVRKWCQDPEAFQR